MDTSNRKAQTPLYLSFFSVSLRGCAFLIALSRRQQPNAFMYSLLKVARNSSAFSANGNVCISNVKKAKVLVSNCWKYMQLGNKLIVVITLLENLIQGAQSCNPLRLEGKPVGAIHIIRRLRIRSTGQKGHIKLICNICLVLEELMHIT